MCGNNPELEGDLGASHGQLLCWDHAEDLGEDCKEAVACAEPPPLCPQTNIGDGPGKLLVHSQEGLDMEQSESNTWNLLVTLVFVLYHI